MRVCKVCGATEDKVKWVVKHGKNVGLVCAKCNAVKGTLWRRQNPERSKAINDAWNTRNKLAIAKKNAKWRQLNKEKVVATNKAWRLTNPEKVSRAQKTYRARHKNIVQAKIKAWLLEHPGISVHYAQARKIAKIQRTPAWANHDAILKFYQQAAELTKTTGVQHHVDHKIPLRGKLVSGLHVENNLQVLTASENCVKHNTYRLA